MIELKDVTKAYFVKRNKTKARIVLDDVSMKIDDNEFVCLIGPSGCGKTTVLNLIAGFERPTLGSIYCNGKEVTGPSPERGVVFQEYSLLPWLSAKSNVKLALEAQGIPEKEQDEMAMEFLRIVRMDKFADMRPNTLSGGMKQRVAIARMLALDPDIMLMDEPFSALDADTRMMLDREIVELWQQKHRTVVFVTHIIEEAIQIASRIVLFSDSPGKIVREWNIDIQHPRDPESPEMIQLKKEISAALTEISSGQEIR